MNLIINILVFGIFVVLWTAFGIALVGKPKTLDGVWASFRGLGLPVQVVLALLLLPVVLGLWIWESRWAFWLRLPLVVGLAWLNLYTFFPRG